MKVKIELKGAHPQKHTFADLSDSEGFTDRAGDLRIKINSSQYLRFDKEGHIEELASQNDCPNISNAVVRRFEIIVREV